MQTLWITEYATRFALTLTLALLAPLQLVHAQSPVKHTHDAVGAAPNHHQSLLENETVRVLETRIAPGERTPVHAHPWPAALYVLSWSDFVRYDPSGKVLLDSRTLPTKPAVGSALWSAPVVPHYIHNVGNTMLHVIAVEIKRP